MSTYAQQVMREREELMEKVQADVDREVAAGNHPFEMLEKLNSRTIAPVGQIPIFHAEYRTGMTFNQSYKRLEQVQLEILEHIKPFWDLAEMHFKGKFFIHFRPRRMVSSFRFELKLFLCFDHPDDFENYLVMSKLHDLPPVDKMVEY